MQLFPFAVAISLFSGAVLAQGNGLSFEVPPPPCLDACYAPYPPCDLCNGTTPAAVQTCYQTTCGFRDVTYASAYYSSTCSDGGYVSYATSPPHDVYTSGSSCDANATTTTATSPAGRRARRALKLVA